MIRVMSGTLLYRLGTCVSLHSIRAYTMSVTKSRRTDSSIVPDGTNVVIELPGGDLRLSRIDERRPFNIRKSVFVKGSAISGLLYDVQYRVTGKDKVEVAELPPPPKTNGIGTVDESPTAGSEDGEGATNSGDAASSAAAELEALAKDKAKQRRDKRSAKVFTLRRPDATWLLTYYGQVNIQRVRRMTPAMMSFMLAMGNVGSSSRVIVIDGIGGLMIGACVQRGAEIKAITDISGPADLLRVMEGGKNIQTVPLAYAELDGEYDSALICSRYDAVDIFKWIEPHIAPSGQVLIYRAHRETLSMALLEMRKSSSWIDVQCHSITLREFQTFPGRIRPTNRMAGESGYVLSATKVLS